MTDKKSKWQVYEAERAAGDLKWFALMLLLFGVFFLVDSIISRPYVYYPEFAFGFLQVFVAYGLFRGLKRVQNLIKSVGGE